MSFQTCNTFHLQNTNSDVFDEIQGLSDSDSKATEIFCYLPCLQAEEHMVPLWMAVDWPGREVIVKKNCCFCLHTKSILVASIHYGWTTDVTWTILSMSLLPFWTLNEVVALLFMQGQKTLQFHHIGFHRERNEIRKGLWAWTQTRDAQSATMLYVYEAICTNATNGF